VAPRQQIDRSNQSTQYRPYFPKKTYRSKYGEFMAAEWRYFRQDINITEETIIPLMPADPKREPDDSTFRQKQIDYEEKIDALYKELNDFTIEYKNKQREMNDEQQGKGAGWRELREHFDEQKVWAAQKRAIM